jgi:hypothetical protein
MDRKGCKQTFERVLWCHQTVDLLLCEKSVIQKHEVTKNSTLDLRTDVYVIGEVKQKNTP